MCEEDRGPASSTSTDARRKKGPFTLPPLSEIKQSNKVGIITAQPILFRPDSHNLQNSSSHGTSLASEITTQSSPPLIEGAGSTMSVTSNADSSVNHDVSRRKRPRNEIDSMVETAPKITHIARVSPQQAGSITTTTTSAGSSSETVQSSTDPNSEGVASTSTTTVMSTAHHPHAIIANLVQVK